MRELRQKISEYYRGEGAADPTVIDLPKGRFKLLFEQPEAAGEAVPSVMLTHLANISYRLGRTLHFDAATMSCRNDPEANRMFTRAYRPPFVVPERV